MLDLGQLSQFVQRCLMDPEFFCCEVLHAPSDDWQREGMEAIADLERLRRGLPTAYNHAGLNRVSVRSGHGTGKTNWLARLIHWWQFTHYQGLVPCTAPKEQQLLTRLWPEMRRVVSKAEPWYREFVKVRDGGTAIWGNDSIWKSIVETASEPENLAGYHAPFLLFVVDEASAERLDAMFPVIEGALTTENAVLAIIGNPTRNRGEFWASHQKRGVREMYYRMHISPDRVQRPGVAEWAERMVAKYGRNSAVVKVRVMGEFAELAENQLIPLDWIVQARENTFSDDGSIPRLRVAVDVADGGDDETVVTVAKLYETHTHYIRQMRYSFPPSEAPLAAGDAAIAMYAAYGGDRTRGDDIVVDAIGVGAGTAGHIMRRNFPVVQYRGGAASDDVKRWRNRRTQTYLVYRDALRDGRITYSPEYYEDDSDWDDHDAQATSIRTKPGADRVEDLETKADMGRRGVKSPDMIDSEVMVHAGMVPVIGATPGADVEIMEGSALTSDIGAWEG